MRLLQRCIAFAIVCFAFVTAAEAACQPNGKTLFQDPFDELAPSWGNFENYHVENGKLIIQPPAGYNTSTLNSASLYDDVDVCVEMTVAPPVKKGNCGGIIFWGVDFDNLYTFQVSTDGTAAVWRRQKGKWLTQIQLQDFAAVRKAANQINELRVTTVGNKAKFFVNGKPFKELTGQPPTGGSQIGLIGCAPSNVSAPVGFDNLVVSGPGGGGAPPVVASGGDSGADIGSGVAESSCTPAGKTLFKDPFNDLAASWGNYDNYRVEAGKLVIQPPAGYNTSTLNNASLYDDVNICAEMTVPPPVSAGNCGGIVFWATDFDNYYTFQISSDGTAVVWRRQKGKWLSQIGSQDFAPIRKSANQVNVLRVAAAGNKAKLFVNGKLFKEVIGQPPQGGSQLGLIGCSPSATSAAVQFDNFIVSGPGEPAPAVAESDAALVTPVTKVGAKCPAPKDPLFADHFETLQTSWGNFENYKVDAGEFLITPPAGYNTSALNTASLYDDVDLCVEMKLRAPVEQGTCGSLIIWAEDFDNYYSFQVLNDGQASFWRRQRGKWLNQIPWQAAEGLNTGGGAVNQLRVMTTGRTAKLFINGKLFKEVQGQPPAGGQEIGLLACAGEKQAAAVGFDNLVVAAAGAPADAGVEVADSGDAKDKVADGGDAGGKVADGGDTGGKVVADSGDAGGEVIEKKTPPEVKELVPPADAVVVPQGRRVALVMGIGSYKAVPALANPPRDAAAIANELSAIGFDVTHIDDLDALTMRHALRDFEQKADGASIALVYYAGHGMEVDGVNYLIPMDAELDRDTHVEDEAVPLTRVLSAVGGARDLRLVLLDACRNNPFAVKMARADGTRAVTRGLARIEPGSSTLVAFAAKEGTTADDGNGSNSPFASALLANMKTRGLEISFLFRRVRDQVLSETGGRQEPFVYGSLSSVPIYLAGQ